MSIKELNKKHQEAIQMLLEGKTVKEVAQTLNIERKSIWRWKKEPVFIAEYNRLFNEISKGITNKHQVLIGKSIKVLEDTLEAGTDKQKIMVAMAIIKAYKPIEKQEDNPEKIKADQIREEIDLKLNPF